MKILVQIAALVGVIGIPEVCASQVDWSRCTPTAVPVYNQEITYLSVVSWDSTLTIAADSTAEDVIFATDGLIGKPVGETGLSTEYLIGALSPSDTILFVRPDLAVSTDVARTPGGNYFVRLSIGLRGGRISHLVHPARLNDGQFTLNSTDEPISDNGLATLLQRVSSRRLNELFASADAQPDELRKQTEPCRVAHLQSLLDIDCVVEKLLGGAIQLE